MCVLQEQHMRHVVRVLDADIAQTLVLGNKGTARHVACIGQSALVVHSNRIVWFKTHNAGSLQRRNGQPLVLDTP